MNARRLALIPLLLLLPLATPGALSIYLRGVAHLTADSYTLGDVASVLASEPSEGEAAGALLATSLGRTPGRPTLLSAQTISELLAEAGHPRVALVGGRVALLPRQNIPSGSERFYEDLLAFLGGTDQLTSGRMEVETLQAGSMTSSAGYEFTLVGQPLPRAAGGTGAAALLAGELMLSYRPSDSASGASTAGSSTIRLWCHRYLSVAYTATSVPARSRLDRGQVLYRCEDVSLTPGAFLTKADGVEQRQSAVGLLAGTRIEPGQLERILTVRAGDAVQVVFLRPGLRVSIPGRAAGSGVVGDRIEVRLRAGGRRFDASIAGVGEVWVEGF
jgi:flagella basal body P-ring formation protein FlgA